MLSQPGVLPIELRKHPTGVGPPRGIESTTIALENRSQGITTQANTARAESFECALEPNALSIVGLEPDRIDTARLYSPTRGWTRD